MLEKNHNNYSKQFMQKILVFIDTVIVNSVSENDQTNINKTMTAGLLNVRDAIFSEIIRDNHVAQLNQSFQQKEELEEFKKNQEKDQIVLDQDQELEKDQQV